MPLAWLAGPAAVFPHAGEVGAGAAWGGVIVDADLDAAAGPLGDAGVSAAAATAAFFFGVSEDLRHGDYGEGG